MAEQDRDRMDQAQDAVRERNIVRDGGVARSDADIGDVSRDTSSSPIGLGGDDDRETAGTGELFHSFSPSEKM